MPRRMLVFEYPKLPPTENHIRGIQYRVVRGKKKAIIGYTPEASAYMRDFQNWINDQDNLFLEIQRFAKEHRPGMVYEFDIYLFFPLEQLLSKGWTEKWQSDSRPGTQKPHKKGERKAKQPHKPNDCLNRQKLLQDCLATAIGIDDTANWYGGTRKIVSESGTPFVAVTLEEGDPADYNIPKEWWP